MITSRLTTKAQTTIPQPVRSALGVQPGDELAYVIEADRVVIVKAPISTHPQTDNPFATFSEWESEADKLAYATL